MSSVYGSVYCSVQLLEEMLDNGYPLATESNILKELIKPPSIVRNVVSTITGDSQYGGNFYIIMCVHHYFLSLYLSLSSLFLPLTVSVVPYLPVSYLMYLGEEQESNIQIMRYSIPSLLTYLSSKCLMLQCLCIIPTTDLSGFD